VLKISLSAEYPNGQSDEPETYTIPLKAMAYNDNSHLAIRDAEGRHVEYLSAEGANDVLLDMWILGMFIRKGEWKFRVEAELEDGRCLFALELTQFLNGSL
jgi:hypothetical protein